MPISETPIPQLGELYQQPAPTAGGAAWFQSVFDAWGAPLGSIESGLAALGSLLSTLTGELQSLQDGLAPALGALGESQFFDAMNDLFNELAQPNPVGTKIPFSFTVPQLPQARFDGAQWRQKVRDMRSQFLQQLQYYLYGGPLPPL
jgi:hypothetical protein